MTFSATQLSDLANALLDYLEPRLDALGADSFGQVGIAHQTIVHDCQSMLKVRLVDLATESNKCTHIPVATFRVELTRCVTNLTELGPVSNTEQTNESEDLLADGWRLWYAIADGQHDGTLFGALIGSCEQVTFGNLLPLWQGDVAGWAIDITLRPAG